MKITAIIPARGGSKGIPKKNLLKVDNIPLVTRAINAAKGSSKINQIIVTTDDASIANIAENAGAEVVIRPAELSTDTSSSEAAILHALENLKKQPDIIVFLQCTSPLTISQDIDNCIEKMIDDNSQCALTVTSSHRFLWSNHNDAKSVNHDSTNRIRRQDLDPEFMENGAVYAMLTKEFKESKNRFFGKISLSEMPLNRSWEIDSYDDIKIVESLLSLQKKSQFLNKIPNKIDAVIFDFDGVFTDNGVYLSERGTESVRCDRTDGWGIGKLHRAGVKMAVMSSEINPVVTERCKKLKIECFHKLEGSKYKCFLEWCKKNKIMPQNIIFIGNDENDIECLISSGCGVVPADAHDSAKKAANVILTLNGGNGAVRQLCDLVLEKLKYEI